MNVSKKITIALALAAGLVAFPKYASAQSTCANVDDLRACLGSAVQDCRDAADCSSDRAEGLTVIDLNEHTCCNPGTSSKKAKKCFKNLSRKLGRAGAEGGPLVRNFLRTGRNEFLNLSKEEDPCGAGSISGL